jgi:hypothetical protein
MLSIEQNLLCFAELHYENHFFYSCHHNCANIDLMQRYLIIGSYRGSFEATVVMTGKKESSPRARFPTPVTADKCKLTPLCIYRKFSLAIEAAHFDLNFAMAATA